MSIDWSYVIFGMVLWVIMHFASKWLLKKQPEIEIKRMRAMEELVKELNLNETKEPEAE